MSTVLHSTERIEDDRRIVDDVLVNDGYFATGGDKSIDAALAHELSALGMSVESSKLDVSKMSHKELKMMQQEITNALAELDKRYEREPVANQNHVDQVRAMQQAEEHEQMVAEQKAPKSVFGPVEELNPEANAYMDNLLGDVLDQANVVKGDFTAKIVAEGKGPVAKDMTHADQVLAKRGGAQSRTPGLDANLNRANKVSYADLINSQSRGGVNYNERFN